MNTNNAAIYLGVTAYKLKQLRDKGQGPKGTPPQEAGGGWIYEQADLDAYKIESTSKVFAARADHPERRRVPPLVPGVNPSLYPPHAPLMRVDDWEFTCAIAREATYIPGDGLVAPAGHNASQRPPSGHGDGSGWHPGLPHWCFDLRGAPPPWVRANVQQVLKNRE